MKLGYALSSEEHSPGELVANARAAEEAGFGFGLVSDHIHPWIDRQGHSPFVWSVIAAMQPCAAELAGRIDDAFVNVAPDAELVRTFEHAGASGRPKYGQVTCCWAESEEEAKQTAWEIWPNAAVEGAASQELPYPEHFEQVAQVASADDLEGLMPLGSDPQPYLEQIEAFGDAGYTHVYLHHIGFDQRGFLDFAKRELLPNVS